jgi:hypothetical protein
VAACRSCNQRKGHLTVEQYRERVHRDALDGLGNVRLALLTYGFSNLDTVKDMVLQLDALGRLLDQQQIKFWGELVEERRENGNGWERGTGIGRARRGSHDGGGSRAT